MKHTKSVKRTGIPLIIYGARGRMGKVITKLAAESGEFTIDALVEKPGHPDIGTEIKIPYRRKTLVLLEVVDSIPHDTSRDHVLLDFSLGNAVMPLLKQLRKVRCKLVSGTTGIDSRVSASLSRYSKDAAVFYDTNMSFGIAVLKHVARLAGPFLAETFDREIVEIHHRHKKDAPSGTALSLAKELTGENNIVIGRGKKGKRDARKIHIHSVRTGGVMGEHRLIFASEEEVLTFSHSALSRDVFGKGALIAAKYISGEEKGMFSMRDILEKAHV